MSSTFYRAFEDRHRGTRETIKDRLRVYTPFVQALLQAYPNAQAVDLGCGRGEWLELMAETGYDIQGVDLDEGMLEACHQRGLNAQTGDAIQHLQTLHDQSQTVVSAFHLVEHMPFDQLQELVMQAMRVLKPGGLLIMETPNPENLVVGTSNFYVDPSHEKPIPPLLLSFLAEYAGFFQVKTLRLQESKGLQTKVQVNLEDVVTGVSPDYAIVAQKAAPQPVLDLTAHAFKANHGLDLSGLLNRWDARFESQMTEVKQAQDQAQAIAQELQSQVQEALALGQLAQTAAEHAQAKAEQAQAAAGQAKNIADQAQATAIQAVHAAQHQAQELNALYASKSWRYTRPLRWIFGQTRRLKAEGPKARSKALVLKVLRCIDQELTHRPALRLQLIGLSQKIGLHAALKKAQSQWRNQASNEPAHIVAASTIEPLSPRAQIIYEDLKKAIEQHQEAA